MKYLNVITLVFIFSINFSSANAQVLDSANLANAVNYRNIKEALENPDEVYKLTLRRKRLTAFPKEIFEFKNLNELNLTNNRISKIPPEIKNLTYLQNLYLGRNEIKSIPVELTELEHLRVLSLNRNKIDKLPPEIGNMYSLRQLDLWGTEIVKFPYEISRLKHTLKLIDMRVIYMQRDQQDEIKRMFPSTELLFSRPCNCD